MQQNYSSSFANILDACSKISGLELVAQWLYMEPVVCFLYTWQKICPWMANLEAVHRQKMAFAQSGPINNDLLSVVIPTCLQLSSGTSTEQVNLSWLLLFSPGGCMESGVQNVAFFISSRSRFFFNVHFFSSYSTCTFFTDLYSSCIYQREGPGFAMVESKGVKGNSSIILMITHVVIFKNSIVRRIKTAPWALNTCSCLDLKEVS